MSPVPELEDELHLLKISVERSSDEVFWLDFEGNILYANDAASRITGYSRDELCTMKIPELDPEMPPGAWEASVANLREKKTQFITSRHRCKNGTFIDVDILAVYVNHGNREFSFAYVRDITERKKAEALLRETDRKYRLLANNVHDVIWTTGRDMKFTYISPSVMELRGLTPEEAMRETFADALTPESYRKLMESRERGIALVKAGAPPPHNRIMELEFRRRDGSTVWADMAITPLFDENRMPEGAVGIIRDITRRRQMEQSLRESQQKLRTVLENLPDLVLVHRDGMILYVNPSMSENMGISMDTVLNTSIFDYIPPSYHARVAAAVSERIENGRHQPYEIEIESPVKGHRIVLIRGSNIEFDGLPAVLTVLTDVTEQKRIEEELRKNRQMLTEAMNLANLVNWEYNVRTNIFTFNDRFYALYDTTAAREGSTLMSAEAYAREFVHPDDQGVVAEEIDKAMRATDPQYISQREHRIIRRDGAVRYIVVRVGITKDGDGNTTGLHGANQDITQRRNAEEALRQSEEKFRSYVENANDIIYSLSEEGLFTYVSPRWTEVLGHDAKCVLGKTIDVFIHPDDLPACHEYLREVLTKGEKKSGIEYRIRHLDGSWQWHTTNASPLRNEAGTIISFLGICRDITHRKRAEDALRSANRQLTLLTGITRHDILNKVSTILGFLSIAEEKESDPAMGRYLEKIRSATMAIRSQVEFTRLYENLGTREPQWIVLDEVMPRMHLPESIALDADVSGISVFSDPMLENVFSNLLDNSIRHGQRVTGIRVSARPSGDNLIIVWEDNGVGIAADEKDRIFERGFGKNTGLGMFLVREILSLTGITITETGEPGNGARFEILVPKGVFRISGS
jgi:PAS domain S-box-containing protein